MCDNFEDSTRRPTHTSQAVYCLGFNGMGPLAFAETTVTLTFNPGKQPIQSTTRRSFPGTLIYPQQRRSQLRMQESSTNSAHSTDEEGNKHTVDLNLGSPMPVDDTDRAEVDQVTGDGAKAVDEIVDELRADLDDVQAETERMANELIEKETAALLEKYNKQKEDILKNVDEDRRIIEEEMEKVKNLAESVDSNVSVEPSKSNSSSRVLLVTTAMFTMAAMYYAGVGLLNADKAAMTNASIDVVFAVASAYFLSRDSGEEADSEE